MASNQSSLDAAALDRKARLAKLASIKRKQPSEDDHSSQADPSASSTSFARDFSIDKHLSGRNYDPEAKGPKLGFDNAPIDGQDTLELRAKTIADTAREEQNKAGKEEKPLDLFALQPKKPNWDLKRDLARKTDLLDQRTDNAIARIVKARIEEQKRSVSQATKGSRNGTDGENVGMAGVDLVEGVKAREMEEAEDERRQQEDQAD